LGGPEEPEVYPEIGRQNNVSSFAERRNASE